MRKAFWERWIAGIIVFLSAGSLVSAQANPSLKDILRKNLEASGGKAKLAQVKNLSFKTGSTRYVVSAGGELMALTGKDPVITEIIRVRGEKVDRNSFDSISQIADPQKTVYQTLAKLYAGIFSLFKFDGQLKLEGVKSFGPEKLYHLTTRGKQGSVATHFYLRTDDFSLKRLVFQGTTAEGDKFEANYDFAPFGEEAGLRLPLSWFSSQVGGRGNLMEVTEVKVNQPLGASFFSTLDLNMGSVKSGPGYLEGNVLEVESNPMGLLISTNWTKKHVDQAGFKTGDELTLQGGGKPKGFIMSVIIYLSASEIPPINQLASGAGILAPGPRGGDTFTLLIVRALDSGLQPRGQLEPLTPISVRKIEK